jgi:ankyrin repeat protein
LLEAGVPVDQKATQGDMTPLHHACSTGRLEAVQFLVRIPFPSLLAALLCVLTRDDARHQLDKGAAIDARNNPGNTGLILAAGRGA